MTKADSVAVERPPSARRGRRPGKPDTRAHILAKARDLFARDGYTGTSLRGVARAAAVDPALVHHYFGDKRGLFLAMMRVALVPEEIVARVLPGGQDGLGERLVATALRVWESPCGTMMVAAVRAAPSLAPALAGYIVEHIIGSVMQEAGVPDDEARLRTAVVETQMLGLFTGRYVAKMEPLASLPHATVVRLFGPIVQRAVDG